MNNIPPFIINSLISTVEAIPFPTTTVSTINLNYTQAPIDNPLKGFVPFEINYPNTLNPYRTTYSHSLAFSYLALSDLMTGPTTFNWSLMESVLNSSSLDNCHAIIRVYLDYPTRLSGIPQYLLNGGLITHSYTDYGNTTSVIPNYSDPNLQTALVNFITNFGQNYDGDVRLGFVEIGLLGYWGEWHNDDYGDYWAPLNTQQMVLSAFTSSFKQTKLLHRYPANTSSMNSQTNTSPEYQNDALPMGYHDDDFCEQTITPPSWYFMGLIQSANVGSKWKTYPIGGEVATDLWYCMWNPQSCVSASQSFPTCVQATHTSWLMNSGLFGNPALTGSALSLSLAGAASLGYEFYVPFINSITDAHNNTNVQIGIKNTGVAPFYYNWQVQFAAYQNGSIVQTWNSSFDIRTLMPFTYNTAVSTFNQSLPNKPLGGFKLLMRIINPLSTGKQLKFANTTQDADVIGWLTLGSIS